MPLPELLWNSAWPVSARLVDERAIVALGTMPTSVTTAGSNIWSSAGSRERASSLPPGVQATATNWPTLTPTGCGKEQLGPGCNAGTITTWLLPGMNALPGEAMAKLPPSGDTARSTASTALVSAGVGIPTVPPVNGVIAACTIDSGQ